jgi:P27 family predicted phage terminase small subunit
MRGRKPSTIITGPSPVSTILKPPTWLSAASKAEWRRIMPDLTARRVLTTADLGGVENYCVAIGRVREIEKLIQTSGFDPAMIRAQDKAVQTSRQLAAELGLTPVSRSRPSMRDDENADDLDFLGG